MIGPVPDRNKIVGPLLAFSNTVIVQANQLHGQLKVDSQKVQQSMSHAYSSNAKLQLTG